MILLVSCLLNLLVCGLSYKRALDLILACGELSKLIPKDMVSIASSSPY
jgi:hypothetical protein